MRHFRSWNKSMSKRIPNSWCFGLSQLKKCRFSKPRSQPKIPRSTQIMSGLPCCSPYPQIPLEPFPGIDSAHGRSTFHGQHVFPPGSKVTCSVTRSGLYDVILVQIRPFLAIGSANVEELIIIYHDIKSDWFTRSVLFLLFQVLTKF